MGRNRLNGLMVFNKGGIENAVKKEELDHTLSVISADRPHTIIEKLRTKERRGTEKMRKTERRTKRR